MVTGVLLALFLAVDSSNQASSSTVPAQGSPSSTVALDPDSVAWIQGQATALQGQANDRLVNEIAADSAERLTDSLAAYSPFPQTPAGEPSDVHAHLLTRIFVSRSMPRDDLVAALSEAQRDPAIVVVFRGLPDGGNLLGFRREVVSWLGPFAHWQSPPNIQIDPPAFEDARVDVVPVVAIYDGNTILASVPGMVSSAWLHQSVKQGRRGRLPNQGPTVAVSEPDLIQVMRQRVANVDWSQWRRDQAHRLLRSMQPTSLPRASQSRVRFHEPVFEIAADIEANGVRFARAGDTVNLLDHVGFSQTLLVVDATDVRQRQLLKRWAAERVGPVSVITTGLPDIGAWDFLEQHSREIGLPIQLYRPELGPAFGIERVPARVMAVGRRFQIEEVDPSNPESMSNDPR